MKKALIALAALALAFTAPLGAQEKINPTDPHRPGPDGADQG